MTFCTHITAKKLSLLAIGMWCCSLPLQIFVTYSGLNILGYQVLVGGWLSPLVGNFAWFSNLFFIFAFLKLQIGKKAIISSVTAGIFSLDTIRYTDHLLNEGGATSPLYGYGYGAILWFLSICLMIAAAGMRNQEEETKHPETAGYDKLFLSGLILFIIVLGSSVYFTIHDRMIANLSEKTRLRGVAFKRYGVCSEPEPMVAQPILNFSGVLEVIDSPEAGESEYPLSKIPTLLSWGIPIVRFNGRDYSIYRNSNGNELVSVPAAGEPAAVLSVSQKKINRVVTKLIRAKLVSSSNRTVFDQIWTRDPLPNTHAHYFCPEYKSFPGEGDQPRSLLVKALNVAKKQQEGRNQKYEKERVKGTIIELAEGGMTSEMMKEQWRKGHPGLKIPIHEHLNANCPDDIGWDDTGFESRWGTGYPFMVKENAYYLPNAFKAFRSICAKEFVYLYRGSLSNGKYYLSVQKRMLEEFSHVWSRVITISNVPEITRDNSLRIESVKEENENFTFELVNKRSGQVLIVKAPKHGQLIK